MRRVAHGLLCALFACLLAAETPPARATTPHDADIPVLQTTAQLADTQAAHFQAEGYRVAHVFVQDEFSFLPSIQKKRLALEKQLAALLQDKPYTHQASVPQALDLVEHSGLIPLGDQAIQITIQSLHIAEIDQAAKTLNLHYRLLSVAIPYNLGGAAETRAITRRRPQHAGGADVLGPPLTVTPTLDYNRTLGLSGGGLLQLHWNGPTARLFNTASLKAEGSANSRDIQALLKGSHHAGTAITDASWQIGFASFASPIPTGFIAYNHFLAQADAATRPFWHNTTSGRFGAFLSGGNLQGNATPATLPVHTIPSTGGSTVRLFTGVSTLSSHNALSASYGLELGFIGPGAGVDWRKHVLDLTDTFWQDLGDHRPLELETTFSLGALQIPGQVPLAEHFFAGNTEHFFVPSDTWRIHDQPFIRAIPANQLSRTVQGTGGDAFQALSLTLSYPMHRVPLVPHDVASDQDVQSAIQIGLQSSQNAETVYYLTKDPGFRAILDRLPAIRATLQTLLAHVQTAQHASTDAALDFPSCTDTISATSARTDLALSGSGIGEYGRVTSLTDFAPSDDDLLGLVQQACGDSLNATLNDPDIASDLTTLDAARGQLLHQLGQLDQPRAASLASADMAFAKRTLNTLFTEVNIYSIAPVAVLDIVRLGPANTQAAGVRFGPGAGLRVELASYVNFTVGYAVNVGRKAGEDRGAMFVSIGFRDLFR